MLTVAIQTMPDRLDLADGLWRELAWNTRVGIEIVVDDESALVDANPWRCYRRCLEATPPGTSHRLILQDDVTVSVGFVDAAWQAARANPERLITFFHAGQPRENVLALDRAYASGDRYVTLSSRRWIPVLALMWPTHLIQPVLEWIDEQEYPPAFRSDDEIIGRACHALHLEVAATVPSLVEHEDVVQSTIGLRHAAGRDRGRVAHRWLAPPDDARALAWG